MPLSSISSVGMLPAKMAGIGAVAVVSALALPSQAHAQPGKRICSLTVSTPYMQVGYMIELRDVERRMTCLRIQNEFGAFLLNSERIASEVQKMVGYRHVPNLTLTLKQGNYVREFHQTCEDFTAKKLSGHWGGNVCHSMKGNKSYVFISTPTAANIMRVDY